MLGNFLFYGLHVQLIEIFSDNVVADHLAPVPHIVDNGVPEILQVNPYLMRFASDRVALQERMPSSLIVPNFGEMCFGRLSL
jgi:hypothetical protein